jgi:thymidylate synthase ThyX
VEGECHAFGEPSRMKVTNVSLCPTDAASAAGRPALTPELMAASGARYSRNNEGLEAILARIDPGNLDKSVDSIFRMIDYGHQSIADMVPVALFIDGISLWLAYYLWTLAPTAGGQESSTRYIKLSAEGLADPEMLGIPEREIPAWQAVMGRAFSAYQQALSKWEATVSGDPEVARIPRGLREDPSDKARKAVARMRRNYAFDRARYFLPVAAKTNVMLLMSARGWVVLVQHLLSHPLPEAKILGEQIREELALSAPRMLRHAKPQLSLVQGLSREFEAVREVAERTSEHALSRSDGGFDHPPTATLEVFPPRGAGGRTFARDLDLHDNRYAYFGETLRRTAVRFGWEAVAFAEIRDLNRHRTGTKYCPLVPVGFYHAADQLPSPDPDYIALGLAGRDASYVARERLIAGDPTYVYHALLGTQFPFEHTTTADKLLYEAELRTGTGAHFRYARHLSDTLALWYQRYPQTEGLVLEGSAEPE